MRAPVGEEARNAVGADRVEAANVVKSGVRGRKVATNKAAFDCLRLGRGGERKESPKDGQGGGERRSWLDSGLGVEPCDKSLA